MREINTSLFERDYLSIISEVFSSASAPPENATNADKSAGADYVNHHQDLSQMQKTFGAPVRQWRDQPHEHRKAPYPRGGIEDEEDDTEPEWVDFDPKKETGNFFGREIKDEQ